MTDEEIKAWMRDNKGEAEDAAELAANYCHEHDSLDGDGEVPDEINVLASEVWDESAGEEDPDDDSDDIDDSDSDGEK